MTSTNNGKSINKDDNNNKKPIARYIDHTLLKANATVAQIEQLCTEAAQYQFASVCVNPCHVKQCARLLKDETDVVAVCTVIGFPLGANTTAVKVYETQQAIRDGATEVDMVMNVGAVQDGHWDAVVEADIKAVVQAAQATAEELDKDVLTKVILETCYLEKEEDITRACRACCAAGADFVKTSTGFGPAGATVEHVRLMRAHTHASMGVKASGGIRSYADAQAMIAAGATRIGTSGGVAIVTQAAEADGNNASGANKKHKVAEQPSTKVDPPVNSLQY